MINLTVKENLTEIKQGNVSIIIRNRKKGEFQVILLPGSFAQVASPESCRQKYGWGPLHLYKNGKDRP